MKRFCRATVVTLALLSVATPVHAQEAVDIDVSIGLQGHVMPYESAVVSVRVHADVLFVGDLQVTAGGVSLFTPIEVPAGSTKDYTIDIPAIGPTGRAIVRLFVDGADEHLVQESVTILNSGGDPLVGVHGAPGIESALTATTSLPFGRSLAILTLAKHELAKVDPLAYLVVGEGTLVGVEPDVIASISDWVVAGGRLIAGRNELAALDVSVAAGLPLTDEATVSSHGSGELIQVDSVAAVADWGGLIRDVPPVALGTNNEFFPEMGFQMVEAASAGGESASPGIPWLLMALALYVLAVGPLNFLVLRRMDRSELAWVTIPAISLLMLSFLWLAGRSQLDGRIVTHASVVVQDSDSSRATSAMIVVAGEKGEHSLDVPAGWSLAPFDTSMMFGRGTGVEASVRAAPQGGTRMGFELPSLGAATLNATWEPGQIPITATLEAVDNVTTMRVRNDSTLEFWAWGVAMGSAANASSDSLGPTESDSLTLRAGQQNFQGGSVIADAVMSQGNFGWDNDESWRVVWPLAETVARQEGATVRSGPYFFGYTDDLIPEVFVDGGLELAHGPTLLIIPLDAPDGLAGTTGVGEIIQITGADFVDAYPGWVYASGADAMELRFNVATDATGDAKLVRQGGHFPGVQKFELYNWETRSFDEFQWLESFALEDHVSRVGEMMARLTFEQAEFNDLEFPTGSLIVSMVTP